MSHQLFTVRVSQSFGDIQRRLSGFVGCGDIQGQNKDAAQTSRRRRFTLNVHHTMNLLT